MQRQRVTLPPWQLRSAFNDDDLEVHAELLRQLRN